MIDELIRVWILYNKIEAWTFRGHKHGKRENDIRCVLSRKSFSVWTHVAHESNVSLGSYKVSLCSMRKHLAFNYKYIFSRTLCNRILNWVVHSFSFLFSLSLSLSLSFFCGEVIIIAWCLNTWELGRLTCSKFRSLAGVAVFFPFLRWRLGHVIGM